MVLSVFQLYYMYGALATTAILAIEYLICRSWPKDYDLIIVVFWPFFLFFGFVLAAKGIYNLIRYRKKLSQ